ncbi:leucine-rich repeat-containing protein 43-like isoform X2 [Betta splendens]|uniref:Leucine-rich repeat-containing protein 43-like isoform X2 n=1 Tax=Betta splendens TaxID=158456 RepID=A0A6P7NK64_BETSP|nr:leucine-rich repeat-containing protein 43-like isoform X2 [Betta splendens]
MDSKKLSAVIEKRIRRLCLSDFPCGRASNECRKSEDSAEKANGTDALLDLLSCPRSPWSHDGSWSRQVPGLRRLAVLTPEPLQPDFIYTYFTTLRIVDKGVTAIDSGLLKFSQLEELVLSVNKIPEIPVENLPNTLKILEVSANHLSSLRALTTRPPPRLLHLGLGSNGLGSHQDAARLTGRHWPQLVCLDLSDCEFQDQRTLLEALRTLPRLRTLVLMGNPFTLASSYPGLAVDSLPRLSCLDASWIGAEERRGFGGLADTTGLIVDQASVKVSVGRMRGIPDPQTSADKDSPDLPVVAYSFSVSYEFLSHQTPIDLTDDREPEVITPAATRGDGSDADLQSDNNKLSRHSTSKLPWSTCMDFSDTQTYTVSDLGALKRFFNQGVRLSIEEEKSSIKSDSAKDKSKDKKKKSAPELVQDAPVNRTLGSVHVPLQSLLRGGQKVSVVCDLGALHKGFEAQATQMLKKDLGKKIKEEEDKELKLGRGKGAGQRTATSSKGKERKAHEMDVLTDSSTSVPVEPPTVEFSVELQRWQPGAPTHLHQ